MFTDPMARMGDEMRTVTRAAWIDLQSLREAPPAERDHSPSEAEKAELQRREENRAEAEGQAERMKQKRREAAPMSWEAGQRLDTYA